MERRGKTWFICESWIKPYFWRSLELQALINSPTISCDCCCGYSHLHWVPNHPDWFLQWLMMVEMSEALLLGVLGLHSNSILALLSSLFWRPWAATCNLRSHLPGKCWNQDFILLHGFLPPNPEPSHLVPLCLCLQKQPADPFLGSGQIWRTSFSFSSMEETRTLQEGQIVYSLVSKNRTDWW